MSATESSSFPIISTTSQSDLSLFLNNLEQSIGNCSDSNYHHTQYHDTLCEKTNNNNPSKDDNHHHINDDDNSNDTTICSNGILKKYAPPGLEEPFQQLHSVLFSNLYQPLCLLDAEATEVKDGSRDEIDNDKIDDAPPPSLPPPRFPRMVISSSSSAAILMGNRGSGKSLLLDRCLQAVQEQLTVRQPAEGRNATTFLQQPALCRKVTIHGILTKGHDVSQVVYEILRQLSELAFHDDITNILEDLQEDDHSVNDKEEEEEVESPQKRRKRTQQDKHLLRLRKSTFTSNLALLESAFQVANADGVPILLILDELDAFIAPNTNSPRGTRGGEGKRQKHFVHEQQQQQQHRQMLLYHLLDRVATPGSNLILIGTTTSFSTLSVLEKRIRSRAEGTAKIIYVRNPQTYDNLLNDVIQHKLQDCVVKNDIIARLSYQLSCHNNNNNKNTMETIHIPPEQRNDALQVTKAMQRELSLGKDVRWFCRVLSTALSLYRHDCCIMMTSQLLFHTKYLVRALVMMGTTTSIITEGDTDAAPTSVSTSTQSDICMVDGMAVDPRIQAMMDLSTPQVALLLAAKRILTRQSHKEAASSLSTNHNNATTMPLTLDRMFQEYESYRRKWSSFAFSQELLKRAAWHLFDVGLLVPMVDHSGGGPLQYHVRKLHRCRSRHGRKLLFTAPLQIPLDMDRELGRALLETNWLDCPTTLKEWGKATA